MRVFAFTLLCLATSAFAQETQELLGHMGGRPALLHLYSTPREDGSARLTGDYVILPTMQQRFLEGDRSKQLGVTVLREGNSAILYGRPALATLQGTWTGGVFKGQRFGPEGQERERFEFSETFPPMNGYSASVKCEMKEGRYQSTLDYVVEGGKLKSLDWRSRVAPADHTCSVSGLQQRPYADGLQFGSGRCKVTMRDLGDLVRVTADDCSELCGSEAYLEPALVDKRGGCAILRPQARQ